MPQTLTDVIRRVRSLLNEPAYPTTPGIPSTFTGALYTDTEITDWINDGCREIARRAETLITYDSTISIPAYGENALSPVPTYPLNLGTITTSSDVFRINRVEFQVSGDSSQIYPLEAASQAYMDNIWNTDQLSTQSYPSYYVTRGYPGGTGRNAFVIQLFPQPAQPGNLNIFYYREPVRIGDPVSTPSNYTVTLDLIEGWDDMAVTYAVMQGQIKNRNPDWQNTQQLFEQKMVNIVNQTRTFNDQAQYFSYDSMMMPWGESGEGW